MSNEVLDLTAFSKAITTLSEALNEYEKDKTNTFVRDSCIQRFKYCYDMSQSFVIQYQKTNSSKWNVYRVIRDKTLDAYDENIAIDIVEQLPKFYDEIVLLLSNIKKSNKAQ